MSARGCEWPISSSVILSTAAAESVKLDMLIFSKSESRGDLYSLFVISEGNFDQCIFNFDLESLELSSHVETLSLPVQHNFSWIGR